MQRKTQYLFAFGLGGLGLITLIYGDFALVWQPVPDWIPGRTVIAYGSGLILLFCGMGMLFEASAVWAARLSFVYCFFWLMLKLPALFATPLVESAWLGAGELAVIFVGAWALLARLARPQEIPVFKAARRTDLMVRLVFGAALIPIGLAHIVYLRETAGFIPHWFPAPIFFAGLTGLAQLACGVCLLFGVFQGWAAILQAAMFSAFTIIVWVPIIAAAPSARMPWTALFVSWLITAAAWIIAADIATGPGQTGKNEYYA
jgi:uncharacterized membrane protein YphA (DoxX/SURF4 family)